MQKKLTDQGVMIARRSNTRIWENQSRSSYCFHQLHQDEQQVDQPGQLLVPLQLPHVPRWRLRGQPSSHSAPQPETTLVILPPSTLATLLSPVVVVQHLSLLLRQEPPLPRSPAERPQPLVAAHRVLPRDPAVVRTLAGAGERQQEEPPHGSCHQVSALEEVSTRAGPRPCGPAPAQVL